MRNKLENQFKPSSRLMAKAISAVLTGAALSVGAITDASAHTMYNGATTAASSDTDGWVYNGIGNPSYPVATPGFYGTSGSSLSSATPFGYAGKAHLNWAAEVHGPGDSLEISTADAQATYGFAAEIDTGAGAWQDQSTPNTGWKHQTDIGLIKAEHDTLITLRPTVVTGTGYDIQNFGITVFTGMDTNTGGYSHHGRWNCPDCTTAQGGPRPYNMDNPFGTQGLTYLTHDATVDGITGLTFLALADQVYSIYLGGAGVGHWGANVASYRLEISAAPVPIPAAAWLLGSAIVGMTTISRRRPSAV